MSMMETARNGYSRNFDKWVALGMIQQAEQVRNIAEMLTASMEDLYDQMEDLNSNLDSLSEATETIQEKIDEMMDILDGELDPDPPLPLATEESGPLPF